jgi:kumamolisin
MARKIFENSVTPLPAQEGLTPQGLMVAAAEPVNKEEKMTVLFSLSIPAAAEADLEEKVASGQVISTELRKNYQANDADLQTLVSWLKNQGFEIVQVSPDSASVYARASASQIEKSLAVNMVRVTKDGITYTAAQNAPSLPDDVGKGVQAIIGLQPFRQAHKNSRMLMPHRGERDSLIASEGAPIAPLIHGAAAAAALAPKADFSPPYFVSDILKAYNADGLAVTGSGQTIAILIDTFPDDADLQAFWAANNLTVSLQQVEKINVNAVSLPPTEGEETLDASWASGIAPGAKIKIYASGSLSFVDLDRALDRILADLPNEPGLKQLSISLGLGETFMAKDEVTTQHQKLLRLAAAGVNIFVSSGDAGSNPDSTGHSSTGPTQAEYESSDTAVVGVGGTSLALGQDGSVKEERGWAGSGGGKSIYFTPRPTWQKGPGMPAGNQRLVPDVSITADPNKGAFLVYGGKEVGIGGTSWSAPVWAGICALLNEARIKAGKTSLPFLNPIMYPLIGTNCFRDIHQGSNGAFAAGPGYDLVTGIGVPNVKELIRVLTQ